jgi:SAM-dependent methyltransferase
VYNRLAWSCSPADYTRFAAAAFVESDGPLLEVAAGSAAATAPLHAGSSRPTTLVDLSPAMLDRAGQRIAAAAGGQLPPHVRLVEGDLFDLPLEGDGFSTILGLGLTHLFDDLPGLARALRRQLGAGGRLHLAGLVAETRRGRRYLELLHRAGEISTPMTAAELHHVLGRPAEFRTTGCMAYATLAGD